MTTKCTVQTIKIVNDQQAKFNNNYKNSKLNLSKTNAAI